MKKKNFISNDMIGQKEKIMNRNLNFGSSKNFNPLNKVADLFDIQQTVGKGQNEWEQEVKGVLSKYRTSEETSTLKKEIRPIQDIEYRVTGYDKFLVDQREKQGLKINKKPIGEVVNASDLLSGEFEKNIKPKKYVDQFGNVYEKIGGK